MSPALLESTQQPPSAQRANSTPLAGELCAFPHPFPQLHPLFQGWSQSEQGVCAERTMPVCACEVGTYSRAPSQSTTACATQL